jgi:uncharacterized protein YndB with AHSA1/START domain
MNETEHESAAAPGTGASDAATRQYFRVVIRAPIHKVWAELTRCGSTLPFFFNSHCATPGLEPGAPIRMRSKDGKYTSVVGDVLEFAPPHRYAHTFKFTNLDEPACVVRYRLREVLVETGKPTPGGRVALFMMGLVAPFTPAKCRSENWPFDKRIE